jgi:hypothetical protein
VKRHCQGNENLHRYDLVNMLSISSVLIKMALVC